MVLRVKHFSVDVGIHEDPTRDSNISRVHSRRCQPYCQPSHASECQKKDMWYGKPLCANLCFDILILINN